MPIRSGTVNNVNSAPDGRLCQPSTKVKSEPLEPSPSPEHHRGASVCIVKTEPEPSPTTSRSAGLGSERERLAEKARRKAKIARHKALKREREGERGKSEGDAPPWGKARYYRGASARSRSTMSSVSTPTMNPHVGPGPAFPRRRPRSLHPLERLPFHPLVLGLTFPAALASTVDSAMAALTHLAPYRGRAEALEVLHVLLGFLFAEDVVRDIVDMAEDDVCRPAWGPPPDSSALATRTARILRRNNGIIALRKASGHLLTAAMDGFGAGPSWAPALPAPHAPFAPLAAHTRRRDHWWRQNAGTLMQFFKSVSVGQAEVYRALLFAPHVWSAPVVVDRIVVRLRHIGPAERMRVREALGAVIEVMRGIQACVP